MSWFLSCLDFVAFIIRMSFCHWNLVPLLGSWRLGMEQKLKGGTYLWDQGTSYSHVPTLISFLACLHFVTFITEVFVLQSLSLTSYFAKNGTMIKGRNKICGFKVQALPKLQLWLLSLCPLYTLPNLVYYNKGFMSWP